MGQFLSRPSSPSAPSITPLHPSLLALAHATAHLRRASRTEDARAWQSWATIIFDTADHERAFESPRSFLPPQTSIPHDVVQAEKWLLVAGKELAKKPIMDAQELFLLELEEYFVRKHDRLYDVLQGESSSDLDMSGQDMIQSLEQLYRYQKERQGWRHY